MKFIIDRQTWLRGEGSMQSGKQVSFLRRASDGKMCCIGQICKSFGFKDDQLTDIAASYCLTGDGVEAFEEAFPGTKGEPNWFGDAYLINDSQSITNTERETQLKKLFTRHGHEIDFIN